MPARQSVEPGKRPLGDAQGGSTAQEPPSACTLPITHEAKIEQHTKTVSAVSFDGSGSRMVTGSYDYNIGYYDFGGMDSALQPFRYVQPIGAYKIKALRFSRCSQWLLVASSANHASLLDREGSKIRDYAEGDQYLRDMKNTGGHAAALSTCHWNPVDPDHFLTASQDGTVRIWNIGYRKRQDYVIVIKSKRPGGRAPVSYARYNNDGSLIATATEDGCLRLYSAKGPWTSPTSQAENAHQAGAEITCLAFDKPAGGNYMASRATDGTLKLWDIRRLQTPVAVASGLPNFASETCCLFSPDDSLIVTGTSAKKGEETGSLVFFDAKTLQVAHRHEMGKSSVVALDWSESLNQIACGHGDGTASVLYNPGLSHKGAILPMSKQAACHTSTEGATDSHIGPILNPHALPMFRSTEGRSLKRARIKARKDPIKSHRPELPVDGPGKGGRLGSSVTQSIMANRLPSQSTRDEDPREALLKYAKIAEEEPLFVTPAYKETQPKPILDASLLVKEAEEERRKAAEKAKAAAAAFKKN